MKRQCNIACSACRLFRRRCYLWLYHDKSGNSIIDVTQYCPKCQSGLFDFRSDDFSPSLRLLLFILFIHGFFFFFFFYVQRYFPEIVAKSVSFYVPSETDYNYISHI